MPHKTVMGTGDDVFERALAHAIAAGRNRSVARCLRDAETGLLKVAEFHHLAAERFLADWLGADACE